MTGTHTGSRTDGVRSTDGATDGSITERTKSAVGTATESAKKTGSQLTHAAAGKADDRKADLVRTARTLQKKSAEFATSVTDEQPQVGHALEQAASKADELVSYVEQKSLQDMSYDFSTQMRRHPMLFSAGMFGIGFALSRVLKPIDSGPAPHELDAGSQPSAVSGPGGSY